MSRHSGRTNPLEDAIRAIQADEEAASPGAPIKNLSSPQAPAPRPEAAPSLEPSRAVAAANDMPPPRPLEPSAPVVRIVHAPLPAYLRPPVLLGLVVLLIGLGVILGRLL